MTAIQANSADSQQSLIAAAQSRFKRAVSQGIVQLMQQCGYSRERATAALLRELGRGDASPDNEEVLDAMSSFGLGVDDASQAFTVSRAVRRAMKEGGLTAVEAIDDLSSKLHISSLVTSSPSSEKPVDDEQPLVSTSRPSSPAQQQRTAPTPTSATTDRVSTQQQHRKRKASAKTNHKVVKQKKTLSRKRPAPDDKKFSSSRERADSVTEAVEAKAKKARRSSPEDSPSPEAASTDASIIVRSKRASRDEQQQSQSNTL